MSFWKRGHYSALPWGARSRSDLVVSERGWTGVGMKEFLQSNLCEWGLGWIGPNLYQVVTNETTLRLRWRGISSNI